MDKYKCIKKYFNKIEVGEIVELQEDSDIRVIVSEGNNFKPSIFYWICGKSSGNLVIYEEDLFEYFERVI